MSNYFNNRKTNERQVSLPYVAGVCVCVCVCVFTNQPTKQSPSLASI
jgi:hypothetical protein